jgi:Holliday junction resolvase
MASNFQTKIIKEYENRGYLVLNVIRFSKNGFPDLQCLKDGRTIWIECKEKKDKLSLLQKVRIDELINNGFEAFCVQESVGQIYPIAQDSSSLKMK